MSEFNKLFVEEEIKKMEDAIDADERYHYAPADVFINAPLALIQVSLDSCITTLKTLRKVLGLEERVI